MCENAYSEVYKACVCIEGGEERKHEGTVLQTLRSKSEEISVRLKPPKPIKLGAWWKEKSQEMLLFQGKMYHIILYCCHEKG